MTVRYAELDRHGIFLGGGAFPFGCSAGFRWDIMGAAGVVCRAVGGIIMKGAVAAGAFGLRLSADRAGLFQVGLRLRCRDFLLLLLGGLNDFLGGSLGLFFLCRFLCGLFLGCFLCGLFLGCFLCGFFLGRFLSGFFSRFLSCSFLFGSLPCSFLFGRFLRGFVVSV